MVCGGRVVLTNGLASVAGTRVVGFCVAAAFTGCTCCGCCHFHVVLGRLVALSTGVVGLLVVVVMSKLV